jgi:AraC-like DNA-binding protein
MARIVGDEVFRRLCRTRDYIAANHAEGLSIEAMAKQAAMSPYHFLRTFQQAFQETPHDFLTKMRLNRAKEMLRTMSVTEVCFEVGFSSVGSFSTLFRRHTGEPPSHYQRRIFQVMQSPQGLAKLFIPCCYAARFFPAAPTQTPQPHTKLSLPQ